MEEYEQLISDYLKHIDTIEKGLLMVAIKFLDEYSQDRDDKIIQMLELLIRENGKKLFS